jgi:hypothetical protein
VKNALIISLFLFSSFSQAFTEQKVGGTITLSKALEKRLTPQGALFVFAKKAGPNAKMANGQPPMAVLKIVSPKFPQAFVLTPNNVMIAGTKFEGPMKVMARYSPTGDAISTPQSLESNDPSADAVQLGNVNLKLDLKTK